jgi:hypothetical protein
MILLQTVSWRKSLERTRIPLRYNCLTLFLSLSLKPIEAGPLVAETARECGFREGWHDNPIKNDAHSFFVVTSIRDPHHITLKYAYPSA